jgi:Phospholipase_D-nuclease N-terminal
MPLRSNTHHPSFIIGAISFVLFLGGAVLRADGIVWAFYIVLMAVLFGAVHWVWSLYDVFHNRHFIGESRIFWFIVVLLIPPLGGMLYYLMKKKNLEI